jgi:hypothetical protein
MDLACKILDAAVILLACFGVVLLGVVGGSVVAVELGLAP